MVAVKLETMKHGDNQHTKGHANLHVLREDAAKLLNVSPRTVATAASVQRHAKALGIPARQARADCRK